MAEHTYARDEVVLSEQLAGFTPAQRFEVRTYQQEAIGYARGRMDAAQDHGLPWCGIDPLDFAASFARHLADAIDARRIGAGSTATKDIRTAWDSFVVNGRVTSGLSRD